MIDIIIFGIIALLIAHRLYILLGTTHDVDDKKFSADIIDLDKTQYEEDKSTKEEDEEITEFDDNIATQLDSKTRKLIQEIKELDKSFSIHKFSKGAEKAFEIIIAAFANGDKNTLAKLCNSDIADNFHQEYQKQHKLGHKININIVGIESCDIKEVTKSKNNVTIKVKISSEQITTITDKSGKIITGDAKHIEEINDYWYFVRDFSKSSPIWKLAKNTN